MSIIRRFLVASSVARLIMRERSPIRIVEGHLPPSHERQSYVLFEDSGCQLVLLTGPGSEWEEEERTEVPAKQGQFLMEVCAGSLAYQRCFIELAGRVAHVDSFRIPERLHLIEVEFDELDQATEFEPPIWFGPEITGEAGYEHNAVAINGVPDQPEIALSDAVIDAVLDFLDGTESDQEPVQEEDSADMVEETTGTVVQDQAEGVVKAFPHRSHRDLSSILSKRREQLAAVEEQG